jgi:hypothetical protein
MSKATTKTTEPTTVEPSGPNGPPADVEIVVAISDLVLKQRKATEGPTLTAISRTTSRAAGLLHFESKEAKIAAENAAAVQIARRSNLI